MVYNESHQFVVAGQLPSIGVSPVAISLEPVAGSRTPTIVAAVRMPMSATSHEPETHLAARVSLVALRRRDELAIFGDDCPTPEGTAIRDYVHVTDLADAHVAAARHLLGGGGVAVNLGTGRGFSIREVVDAVERVAGLHVPRRVAARRQGDLAVLVADGSRAQRLLGFTAPHSDIDTIVRTAHA